LLKINCNKLVKGIRSLITTFRLFRNTYIFIASLANKAKRATFVLLSIINTLVLKTLALRLSKNTL